MKLCCSAQDICRKSSRASRISLTVNFFWQSFPQPQGLLKNLIVFFRSDSRSRSLNPSITHFCSRLSVVCTLACPEMKGRSYSSSTSRNGLSSSLGNSKSENCEDCFVMGEILCLNWNNSQEKRFMDLFTLTHLFDVRSCYGVISVGYDF